MTTYPRLLSNNCRFSVLAESSAPIMHYTAVVIFSPKRVNRRSGILVKISLRSWNKLCWYIVTMKLNFQLRFRKTKEKTNKDSSYCQIIIRTLVVSFVHLPSLSSSVEILVEWSALNIFLKLNWYFSSCWNKDYVTM